MQNNANYFNLPILLPLRIYFILIEKFKTDLLPFYRAFLLLKRKKSGIYLQAL